LKKQLTAKRAQLWDAILHDQQYTGFAGEAKDLADQIAALQEE
jgi:hypothetical protein